VIADYKTDRVSADDVAAQAEVHRAQGRAYVDALTTALRLEEPPRFELWFLHAGRVVPVAL